MSSRDNRTHCRNVRFRSFSRKHFLARKLFRIVFAGAVRVFPDLHFDAYGSHTGPFFLWFSKEIARGAYGSYDNNNYDIDRILRSDWSKAHALSEFVK